jgi:hypothetical protein
MSEHDSGRTRLLQDGRTRGETYGSGTPQQPKDKLHEIQLHLNETKAVMKDNIELVIARGENITSLQDKAEQLKDDAGTYHLKAKELRKAMCRKNAKNIGIIILVVLFIIGLIVIALHPWSN